MIAPLASLAFNLTTKDATWPVLPIIAADMNTGEIVYASKFAADIFGYAEPELTGQIVEILLLEAVQDQHARWRQDASVPKTRLMGIGRLLYGRKKDGTIFPLHIGLTATKVLDRSIGVAFVVDLTGIILTSNLTSSPASLPSSQ